MAIQFLCPHCNKQFRTPDEYAGKLTKCKQCGQTMRIPELASFGAAPSQEPDDEQVASFPEVDAWGGPAQSAPFPEAPSEPAPFSFAGEQPADSGFPQIQVGAATPARPHAQKPIVGGNKGGQGPYFNLNRGTIALFIFTVFLLALGIRDAMLSAESSGTPTKMTVQDLLRRGSKGNRHVVLTNAYLWIDGSVYEGASESSKNWSRVWVPVVDSSDPALAAGGRPRIRMILRTSRVKSAGQLEGLAEKHQFQGMITTGFYNLQDDERKLLAQSFPELGSGNVHVFDEGSAPPSPVFMILYFGGGLALGAAAIYMTFMMPPVEGM